MDQLPAVLQNEIWEYVRGGRAFWKTKHAMVIDHMQYLIAQKNDIDVNNSSNSWANRNLICHVVNEQDNEVEHSDHLHAKPFLFSFEKLGRGDLDIWARKEYIKNPKFHAKDLSFLIHGSTSTCSSE
jgi:hypothetical protein